MNELKAGIGCYMCGKIIAKTTDVSLSVRKLAEDNKLKHDDEGYLCEECHKIAKFKQIIEEIIDDHVCCRICGQQEIDIEIYDKENYDKKIRNSFAKLKELL